MSGRKESGFLKSFIGVWIAITILVFTISGVFELFGGGEEDSSNDRVSVPVIKEDDMSKQDDTSKQDDISEKKPDEKEETVEKTVRKYYYEQLNEEEKQIYNQILEGMLKGEEKIQLSTGNPQISNKGINFVLNDYPEIFWCNGEGKYSTYDNKGENKLVLIPKYLYESEEREKRIKEIENASDTILASAPSDGTDYEKVKYVFEALVDYTSYKLDAPDCQNIYSTFVNRETVCAGYAKATQYLLEKLGVFCTYVTGDADNGTGPQLHAWNLVQCEEKYYYVDTTWGDNFADTEKTTALTDYDYLCANDKELFITHIPDSTIKWPECTSMDCNYYVLNGMYYEEYNKEQLVAAMKKSYEGQEERVIFKFANADLYNMAKDKILKELVYEAMGEQKQFSYRETPNRNKLEVFWKK